MSYSPTSGNPGTGPNLGAMAAPEEGGKRGKKSKSGKKPTKRVVDKQIIIAVVFAIIVAGFAFLFFTRPESGTFVVRAKADIAALTPMTTDLVEVVKMPDGAVQPSAIQGASQAEAAEAAKAALANTPRAKFLIPARAQISTGDFGADLSLDTPLVDGERLMSLSATVVNGVSGQLKPGDIVDILGTAQTADGSGSITGTLASAIPIVAVKAPEDLYRQAANDQQNSTQKKDDPAEQGATDPNSLLPADPVAPGIYLVRVPADVAVKLVAVQNDGEITLLYRGVDSADLSDEALSSTEAICAANPTSEACSGGTGFAN